MTSVLGQQHSCRHSSLRQHRQVTSCCVVAAGLLFFQLLFLSFRQLFVALFTFPDEFKMLLKERASGMYRLSAFYFARTASDLPMDMAIPTLFLLLVYFMGHLRYTAAAFFANFFTVILVMLVGYAILDCLSRACPAASVVFCQLITLCLLTSMCLASRQCLLALAACAGNCLLHVQKSGVPEDHGHL